MVISPSPLFFGGVPLFSWPPIYALFLFEALQLSHPVMWLYFDASSGKELEGRHKNTSLIYTSENGTQENFDSLKIKQYILFNIWGHRSGVIKE